MVGMIANKQVLSHFGLIWREFGPLCATRCLAAMLRRRPTTFLNLAFKTGTSDEEVSPARACAGRPAIKQASAEKGAPGT
jgi:hypothetical protein